MPSHQDGWIDGAMAHPAIGRRRSFLLFTALRRPAHLRSIQRTQNNEVGIDTPSGECGVASLAVQAIACRCESMRRYYYESGAAPGQRYLRSR